MRILWVKVGGLWPANSGGRLRSYHILSELSQQHEVTVVTTRQAGEAPAELARHLPRCERVISVPYHAPKHGSGRFIKALAQSWFTALPVDLYKNRVPAMRRTVTRLLTEGNFDLCVADFLTGLPNVPHDVLPSPVGPPSPVWKVPIVLFTHNVEHMIWQRLCSNEGNPLKRLLLAIEWRKMRAYEKRACQLADLALTVSETDKELFQRLAPTSNLHAIPTGVDVNYFSPMPVEQEQELELVFSGSMDWFPNEDAMLWFMDSMLPLIRREKPGITVTIVGRNPSAKLQRLAAASKVHVTGTVDDVRPSVHRAAVYIVPLRIGGGTRLKLFEAAAMGKAIVSTTVGAEGLPLEHGKHLVLADTPEDFARQVLKLVEDPALRARLGRAGRELVQTRYSWARVAKELEALCHEVRHEGCRNADTALNNHNVITGGSEI
jgi:sugar transferase (PEP-CTERM/EpsH1 system associated)